MAATRTMAAAAIALAAGVAQAQVPPTCTLEGVYVFGYDSAEFSGICTNHGVCTDNGCVCDEHWTGRSDFINTEGFECQIFEPAIKGLWCLILALVLFMGIKSLPRIKVRYRQYLKIKADKHSRGRTYPMYKNRALMCVLSYHFVGFPAIVGACVIRLIDDQQRVGMTAGMTLLFTITKIGFYFSVFFFQPALLNTILRGTSREINVGPIIWINNFSAVVNLVLSCITSCCPLVTLISGDEVGDIARGVYLFYMGATVFNLVFYGTQAIVVLIMCNEAFSTTNTANVISAERLIKIKAAMSDVQHEGIRQTYTQSVMYGAFLFWPFLWNKHDYFLPIGWVAIPLITKKFAFTAIEENQRTGTQTSQGASYQGSKEWSKDTSKDDNTYDTGNWSSTQADSSRQLAPQRSMPLINPPATGLAGSAVSPPTPSSPTYSQTSKAASQYSFHEPAADDTTPEGPDVIIAGPAARVRRQKFLARFSDRPNARPQGAVDPKSRNISSCFGCITSPESEPIQTSMAANPLVESKASSSFRFAQN